MISIMDFFTKCDQFTSDLVIFTEKILRGGIQFF